MSISFMHNFESQIGSIQEICPAIYKMTIWINYRLIEIQPI